MCLLGKNIFILHYDIITFLFKKEKNNRGILFGQDFCDKMRTLKADRVWGFVRGMEAGGNIIWEKEKLLWR